MRIDVVGRHLDVTDAMREHAESKLSKLPKYFDGTQQIVLTLSKDDHHKHGEFGVELRIDVEKHRDFILHAHGEDLYAAIDQVAQKGARELADYKERLKTSKR